MTDALIESIDLHGTLVIGGRTVRIDITTDEPAEDADQFDDVDDELDEEGVVDLDDEDADADEDVV
jgi:hypothetical protein